MAETVHESQHQEGRGVHVRVDVAHAGELWSRDPHLTWEALNQLEGLLETMVEDLGGTILPESGDAFVVRFNSAAPAVMWCARMQEGLLALDWPDTLGIEPVGGISNQNFLFGGLLARMAIHKGPLRALRSLVSAAQPGQVLVSAPTWAAVDSPIPPDLQVRPLGSVYVDGVDTEVLEVTTRLLSKRRFAPLPSIRAQLPSPPNCFVGRSAAVADLFERLEAGARMVNITGPKGVGKTRLALHRASAVETMFPGSVSLVPLENTTDETDLLIATAEALGIALGGEAGGVLRDRIGSALAARGQTLFVLDGFNAKFARSILDAWVRAAPDARFIVTSDEPVDSELATHLHLSDMDKSDAFALFLARHHRELRSQERPPRAMLVEMPKEGIPIRPAETEAATGMTNPSSNDEQGKTMDLRRIAMDPTRSPTIRIEAALSAQGALERMGLGAVGQQVLEAVKECLQDLPNSSHSIRWNCARVDSFIHQGLLSEAKLALESAQKHLNGTSDSMQADVLLRAGNLAAATEQWDEAKMAFERALDCAPAPLSPWIQHAYGSTLYAMDEWESATTAFKHAVTKHTDPLQRALADAALGRVLLDQGKEQSGQQALNRAMNMAHIDPHLEATIHQHRFEYASAILNLKSAQHHLQAQLRILQSCGDRAGHARCHIQLGVLDLISRSPESAISHLQAARILCQTGGMPNLEAHALANAGVAARLSGDLAGAQDAFAEAAALASTQKNHALAGYIYAHIGAAEASWDSINTAEEAFEEANRNLELSGDALMSTIQDALMGFVDLARAREAALDANEEVQTENIDSAMNRLARASSFETRSTPPRGREVPSRINEIRLARLLLDGALSALEPGH